MDAGYKYFKKQMHKRPLERCSAVFTKVPLKIQCLFYKSAVYLKHRPTHAMELSCENA